MYCSNHAELAVKFNKSDTHSVNGSSVVKTFLVCPFFGHVFKDSSIVVLAIHTDFTKTLLIC